MIILRSPIPSHLGSYCIASRERQAQTASDLKHLPTPKEVRSLKRYVEDGPPACKRSVAGHGDVHFHQAGATYLTNGRFILELSRGSNRSTTHASLFVSLTLHTISRPSAATSQGTESGSKAPDGKLPTTSTLPVRAETLMIVRLSTSPLA